MLLSTRPTAEQCNGTGNNGSDQDGTASLASCQAHRNIRTSEGKGRKTSTTSDPVDHVGAPTVGTLGRDNGIEVMITPFGGSFVLVDIGPGGQLSPLHEPGHDVGMARICDNWVEMKKVTESRKVLLVCGLRSQEELRMQLD